ncbi:hypothetical protein [Alteriqipengyuania lutimaris]|uniref:Uncharacterized protein n=1 Tax=Alteriqipengyuania lutimaris TaxID=1538146 RepID=A0A395LL43_9SPHN|nr:hypothetical protein [Alteriqipengyuania lutimaris]MBB3033195.1 uncharacterized protein (DUF983 family) [Alteriqipengyuania lutimaris]RDS77756.1 hypothetical protein DL238_09155 [Alteriqipengyuania lutimaris]
MPDDGREATGGSAGTKGQPALREAALFGLCPRCGARTLFAGWIAFAERGRSRGLDFSRSTVGDGPAAFLAVTIGGLRLCRAAPLWSESRQKALEAGR